MIRLIIQHNAPPILKYNKEIETDKAFIIQHFSSANAEVKKFIQKTAKSTGVFTQEELTKDRKSTRLNSSHVRISYAVFCLKKKTTSNTVLVFCTDAVRCQ